MIIDVHTHIVPEHFPEREIHLNPDSWPLMAHGRSGAGSADVMISGKNFRTVTKQCWEPSQRLADMGNQGVDQQVLSPMPRLLDYSLSPSDGLALARFLNQSISELVRENPDRFFGLGSVPMQDVGLAIKELATLKALGLSGVEITTNINGSSPGESQFVPFWKEVDRLSLSVFIHGQDPTFAGRLVGPDYLENAIGFPIENTLAALSLITGGILERFPALRVCTSHGGGPLAMVLPRLQHLWHNNASLRASLQRSPTEYARRLFYDDVLFDNRALRYLIDIVGSSQIVIGSDYPFMDRPQNPEDEFYALGLTSEERTAMGSANCLRFLGVTP